MNYRVLPLKRANKVTGKTGCYIVLTLTQNSILISNFRLTVNVVFFLLGDSPASEFYVPRFRSTLSVPSSYTSTLRVY